MKELLELFNWSAVAKYFKSNRLGREILSHAAVLKAVKKKGRAGLGYVQHLRDVIVPDLVREYENEYKKGKVFDVESKQEVNSCDNCKHLHECRFLVEAKQNNNICKYYIKQEKQSSKN